MNPIVEVSAARRLVTKADERFVGGGALAGLVLDCIGVARKRLGRRPTRGEIRVLARLRGLDDHDARDVEDAMRYWRY